ncbi:MAG: cupin domain-containing protein [Ruminococcaceae bacterium]|nr:cupin domain-containing protein [Oscillospiraceae bacterium]
MKIDFNKIEEKVTENFKGGEGEMRANMFFDGTNRIMKALLVPGASIGMHCHETSSEIIYILSGTGKAIYEGKEIALAAGDCHYCKKGFEHSLINCGTEALVFFAVVPEH